MNGPLVIGGVGGSGTRLFAEIIRSCGVYIGSDLNQSLDNLTFTFLFKRPGWLFSTIDNVHLLSTGFGVLEKCMCKTSRLTYEEHLFSLSALFSMFFHGHNHKKDGRGLWAMMRYIHLIKSSGMAMKTASAWGWKEPNSHLLLDRLSTFFPGLKYIHIIRNGLDMAFSENQQQVYTWGNMFNVRFPANHGSLPQAAFRYWVESNKKVLEIGLSLGPERFMVVNFDKFCLEPAKGIAELLSFMNFKINDQKVLGFAELVKIPASIGRYREKDISWLTVEDIMFLEKLGFSSRQ